MGAYLETRFGIGPACLEPYRLVRRGEYICLVRREAVEPAGELKVVQAGLKLLKESGKGAFKPATRGFQILGKFATRNVVELSLSELRAVLQGGSVPCSAERGFVLLRSAGSLLGVGLVREGQLVGQLPRGMTEHLRLPKAEAGGL